MCIRDRVSTASRISYGGISSLYQCLGSWIGLLLPKICKNLTEEKFGGKLHLWGLSKNWITFNWLIKKNKNKTILLYSKVTYICFTFPHNHHRHTYYIIVPSFVAPHWKTLPPRYPAMCWYHYRDPKHCFCGSDTEGASNCVHLALSLIHI